MTTSTLRSPVWETAARDADLTLLLPGDVPMFFRRIRQGSFLMGSRGEDSDEEPVHRVVIPHDFYLGTFVVTQEQYRAVAQKCSKLKESVDPSDFKGARRPVENVNWLEATAFCNWLAAWKQLGRRLQWKGGSETITSARLPLEAEWEYACRAGTDTDYYHGDGAAPLAEVGWFEDISENQTHEVDERWERHPWGLFGMHGNVDEWCRDVYDPQAYRKRAEGWIAREWTLGDAGNDAHYWDDEQRRKGLPSRVLRGGSWFDSARRSRSAYRDWDRPDFRNWGYGFRVCLVPGPTATGSGEAEPTPGDGGRRKRPESDGVGGASDGAPDLATASFPKVSAGASTHQISGEVALLCGVQTFPPTDVEGYGEDSGLVTLHSSLTSGGAEAPAEAGHRGRQLIHHL